MASGTQNPDDSRPADTIERAADPWKDPVTRAQGSVGGRYRIAVLVGAGAMGRVFQATDEVLRRRVAIKLLQGDFVAGRTSAGTTSTTERLISEARAMAGLNHPNVCRVLEVILEPATSENSAQFSPFIVMDWIDGIDLRMAWRGTSLPRRVAQLLRIADGVAAIHAAGLVHQDLKPSNILVDRQNAPIIVDFGLARGEGADLSNRIGGTPGWAAPEQLRTITGSPEPIGPGADVFALGVLLYEALTDRLPFSSPTVAETIQLTCAGRPELPENINGETPAALQRVCLAALDPDPALRYPDASAFLADLRRAACGETVRARPRLLFDRFSEQIEGVLSQVDQWHHQGLVTSEEARSVRSTVGELQRPESPWIVDSRRLRPSQVALYLGGWMFGLAVTLGMWNSRRAWISIWPPLDWLVPAILAILVLAIGLWLRSLGQMRAALAFLVTATIGVAAATWQMSRSLRLFTGADGSGMGASLEFVPSPDLGLQNRQSFFILFVAGLCCAAFRRLTGSGAFALFASLVGMAWWATIWLLLGRLAGPDRAVAAEFGGWVGLGGVVALGFGVRLNSSEESHRASVGRDRVRTTDAWPVLTTGVLAIVGGLSVAAWFAPERFLFASLPDNPDRSDWLPDPSESQRAAAFLVCGVLFLLLSLVLSRRPTALRDRLARFLRWIIPSYFLLPIAWLEYRSEAPGWGFWLAALVLGAVALCFGSVLKQWKPFMLTGLAYLAEGYVRAFVRLDAMTESHWAMASAMLLPACAGLAVMCTASRAQLWSPAKWLTGHLIHREP